MGLSALPSRTSAAGVLALQRSAGNQAVMRMLAAGLGVQREPGEAPPGGEATGAPVAGGQRAGRIDTPVGIVYASPDRSSAQVAQMPRDSRVPVKGRSGD